MQAGAGADRIDLALAVPIDGLPGPVPGDLTAISSAAASLFDMARRADWTAASGAVASMNDAATRYRAAGVPPRLYRQLQAAVDALTRAVAERNQSRAGQASVDLAVAALDLELRYRPAVDVDVSRMDVWARQTLLDAQAKDVEGVASDAAIEEAILARTAHAMNPATKPLLDDAVRQVRKAADGKDFTAAAEAADRIRGVIASQNPGR
jgi:hypothetical protein